MIALMVQLLNHFPFILNTIIQVANSQSWLVCFGVRFICADAADEHEESCATEEVLTEGLTDAEPFSSPKESAFTLLGRSIMKQSYVIALIIMMVTLLSAVYRMPFCMRDYKVTHFFEKI